MNYFTLDWWNGIQTGDSEIDPHEGYEDYYQSIKENLPSAFDTMRNEIFLHDGCLRKIDLNIANSQIHMVVDTDDGKGNLRVVNLIYSGVSAFSSSAVPEKGLAGPNGYGDWGYDEVEFNNNELVHSILFSSGIELNIKFKNIVLTC